MLFIRDADVSGIVSRALAAVAKHPNCMRHGTARSEERHDFVIHATGDKHREIHLAFLPFLIASRDRNSANAI